MKERERPERDTTLRMISSFSGASTSFSSRMAFRAESVSGIPNTASTTQLDNGRIGLGTQQQGERPEQDGLPRSGLPRNND